MRFTTFLASTLALVASALAVETTDSANPLSAPLKGNVLKAGEAFTIQWLPTAGSLVKLVLRKGEDVSSLDTLEVIAGRFLPVIMSDTEH